MEYQSMEHVELPEEITSQDSLKFMLDIQKELNRKIYPIILDNLRLNKMLTFYGPNDAKYFTDQQKEEITKEYLVAIIREASEALDMINSKAWKAVKKDVNLRELKFEFIDLQHFINCIYDVWSMDREEILKFYVAKNKENIRRYTEGY